MGGSLSVKEGFPLFTNRLQRYTESTAENTHTAHKIRLHLSPRVVHSRPWGVYLSPPKDLTAKPLAPIERAAAFFFRLEGSQHEAYRIAVRRWSYRLVRA
jgi:hypothetical protein